MQHLDLFITHSREKTGENIIFFCILSTESCYKLRTMQRHSRSGFVIFKKQKMWSSRRSMKEMREQGIIKWAPFHKSMSLYRAIMKGAIQNFDFTKRGPLDCLEFMNGHPSCLRLLELLPTPLLSYNSLYLSISFALAPIILSIRGHFYFVERLRFYKDINLSFFSLFRLSKKGSSILNKYINV